MRDVETRYHGSSIHLQKRMMNRFADLFEKQMRSVDWPCVSSLVLTKLTGIHGAIYCCYVTTPHFFIKPRRLTVCIFNKLNRICGPLNQFMCMVTEVRHEICRVSHRGKCRQRKERISMIWYHKRALSAQKMLQVRDKDIAMLGHCETLLCLWQSHSLFNQLES